MSEEDTHVKNDKPNIVLTAPNSIEEDDNESSDSSSEEEEEEEQEYYIYMTDSCGDNSHTTSENDGGTYYTEEEAISAAENLKCGMCYISISDADGEEVWCWSQGDDEWERINKLEKQVVDLKQKLEEANKEIVALKNNNQ